MSRAGVQDKVSGGGVGTFPSRYTTAICTPQGPRGPNGGRRSGSPSPPCSAGIAVRTNFSILGWLPPPVAGWSDITRLYLQKFGLPGDNQRVFIRVRQFNDGWQDQPREFQARMPRAWPRRPRRSRALASPLPLY